MSFPRNRIEPPVGSSSLTSTTAASSDFNADMAGRPQLIHGNRQMLFWRTGRPTENSVVTMKNKSYAVTAQIDVPVGGGHGTVVAQGGAFGGWSLYLLDGKPAHCYNLFGTRMIGDAVERLRGEPGNKESVVDHDESTAFGVSAAGIRG